MLAVDSRLRNRVLGDNTAIIFDFNIQAIVRQDTPAEFENLTESVRTKPVFRIASDMCLQQHFFLFAGFASAIDKVSDYVANFGHMRMSRDIIPTR